MRVTGYKIYRVKPRWVFLKVMTDEGISGWGECISGTRTEAIVSCVTEAMDTHVVGKDPANIEDIWQCLYRYFFRGGPVHMTCVSGIEMALWDIKGKSLGMPVWQLLGGAARDRIRVYSWIGGDRPSDAAAAATQRRDAGFTAVKLNCCSEMHYIDSFAKVTEVTERIASIRETVGYDIDVAIDFHGRVHKAMAKQLLRELEPFHPMFVEEPVLPENTELMADLANSTTIPIATGERLLTRWGYKQVFADDAVSVVQPDLALTGGILEAKKICATAEAHDMAAAPHAPYGPIALAATLQLDTCTPNVFIQEQSLGIHYNQGFDLLDFVKNKELFHYENGYVAIPQNPGLGLDMDEEMVERVSLEGLVWTNPRWRNYDGTIAEW